MKINLVKIIEYSKDNALKEKAWEQLLQTYSDSRSTDSRNVFDTCLKHILEYAPEPYRERAYDLLYVERREVSASFLLYTLKYVSEPYKKKAWEVFCGIFNRNRYVEIYYDILKYTICRVIEPYKEKAWKEVAKLFHGEDTEILDMCRDVLTYLIRCAPDSYKKKACDKYFEYFDFFEGNTLKERELEYIIIHAPEPCKKRAWEKLIEIQKEHVSLLRIFRDTSISNIYRTKAEERLLSTGVLTAEDLKNEVRSNNC